LGIWVARPWRTVMSVAKVCSAFSVRANVVSATAGFIR
jgi:hypothetical protein